MAAANSGSVGRGREEDEKPVCKLLGTDGNVFALMGRVTSTLKRAGQQDKAEELAAKVWDCSSYDEALQLFMEYVDVE